VRQATLADAAALGRVHVAAWRAAYAGVMPAAFLAGLDPERFRQRWERWLGEGATALVVESAGEIAGFCLYGRSRDADAVRSVGEIIAINLDPAFWRRGLGRALLLESVARLRREFGEATLWVVRENDRARRFYEALGWQADGAVRTDTQLTGTAVHEVRYRTAL
jgi:ribosomal protein S18 acetylase RimI-like enzyme